MEIYIKPTKKAEILKNKDVYIGDIAEVYCEGKLRKEVEKIALIRGNNRANRNVLVTIIDLLRLIDKRFPGNTIVNVGEMETVVSFVGDKPKKHPVRSGVLTALVALVLFAGSSTAIMSFHTDAEIPKVFENYYYIFFGEKIKNPALIDIPYAIGLAAGIIIFFGHFGGRRLTNDPTPIEVEMSLYDGEVSDAVIGELGAKRQGEPQNGGN